MTPTTQHDTSPPPAMTRGQAQEWVHNMLIVVDMRHDELVAAFTALANRPPGTTDRKHGLFRRCCEIVTSAATPQGDRERGGAASNGGHRG